MEVLNKLIKDSKLIPQTFLYKYYTDITFTIEDQSEALTNSDWAFHFACQNIPGSDIKALQAKACEGPIWAYQFAIDIPGADNI